MKVSELYIKNNRPGTAIVPGGVVIHETGNLKGADAMAHQSYWDKNPSARSSAHTVLDWENIIRLIPYNEKAWHAGKTANEKYIGIEICRCVPFDTEKFNAEWEAATDIVADIFRDILKTSVTPETLMSHAEVSEKWRETNHTDPVWYFSQAGKTMEDFRRDVREKIKAKSRHSYDNTVENMIDDGITDPQNMAYWERVLRGEINANPEFLRAILDRYHRKIN